MRGAKGVIISITGGEDMRLMEVDEAANHIKDLVDPDANIIWGSAFNNDLEGKIRVSVVATGIDAVEMTQAPVQPAKVFTFPGSRSADTQKTQAIPQPRLDPMPEATPEPEAAPIAAQDQEDQDLALPTEEEASDELLLGEVDMVADEEMEVPAEAETRSWVSQDEEEPRAAEPAPKEGGTLFERMSNIARGAAKAQVEEEGPRLRRDRDPLDIPRFLNRQNNQ
jgi:cell division protein FtsZ